MKTKVAKRRGFIKVPVYIHTPTVGMNTFAYEIFKYKMKIKRLKK